VALEIQRESTWWLTVELLLWLLRFLKHALAYIAFAGFSIGPWAGYATPSVLITNLPPYGTFDQLGGIVLETVPESYRIAVFIYVPGYGWVSKPTCAEPLTVIQADGSWTADITTGGSDQFATRVAALLVSTNYAEPCVDGAAVLPANVYSQAIASAVTTRPSPGVRWLSFSGYAWWVKTATGLVGPGPNYFSDSTNNVWLDAQGRLHLRITNRSNQWQCAEIISARTFGYGNYRFELDEDVDNLDVQAVLGLFTWSDDPAYAHREIDVECSRWGNAADSNNAQFVVQPFDKAGHLVRYDVPSGVSNSTHISTWETNRVSFQSLLGGYSPSPDSTNIINSWSYSLAMPQTGDENVRLNFWLYTGSPPAGNSQVEVIIKSFEFVPLELPRPALLADITRLPNGLAQFSIQSQPDRRYQIQATTNLIDWRDVGAVLATNVLSIFSETNSSDPGGRFFRTLTLP